MEVGRIARIFRATNVLLGRQASTRTISRLAAEKRLEKYDLLHFATHALVDYRLPMNSAILLSKSAPPIGGSSERSPISEDGLLTSSDIVSTWKLDADLVTLSACQTGTVLRGTLESLVGLDGALFEAGARSLLVSLWEVDDRATALLMGRFYENLVGVHPEDGSDATRCAMPKDRALQEAKQWLCRYRDPAGHRPFENPAFWAPFVLIGDVGE
jgi:CHAT domain-containing protein